MDATGVSVGCLKKILYKGDTSALPLFLQIFNIGISKKRQCVKIQFSDTINLSNVIEEPLQTGNLFKLHAIVEITDYEVMPVEEESSTMFEKFVLQINKFGSVNTKVTQQFGRPRFLNAEDIKSLKDHVQNVEQIRPIATSTPIPRNKPASTNSPNQIDKNQQPMAGNTSSSPLNALSPNSSQKQEPKGHSNESTSNTLIKKRKISPSIPNTPSILNTPSKSSTNQPSTTLVSLTSKDTPITSLTFDGQKLLEEDETILQAIPDVLLDNSSSNQEKKSAMQKQEILFHLNNNYKKLKKEYDIIFKQAMTVEKQLKQLKDDKISIEKNIGTLENELFDIENEIVEVEKVIQEKEDKKKFLF